MFYIYSAIWLTQPSFGVMISLQLNFLYYKKVQFDMGMRPMFQCKPLFKSLGILKLPSIYIMNCFQSNDPQLWDYDRSSI